MDSPFANPTSNLLRSLSYPSWRMKIPTTTKIGTSAISPMNSCTAFYEKYSLAATGKSVSVKRRSHVLCSPKA